MSPIWLRWIGTLPTAFASVRTVVAGTATAAIAIITATSSTAWAGGESSAWSEGFNNKARLHIGAVVSDTSGNPSRVVDGPIYAGLEIVMPPGWKTYWRTPGDAGGIPPEFDWAGSENLRSARVAFPAPRRLVDKSGTTYGYEDRVVFPIEVIPKVATEPVVLKLAATYGVCKDICIPAETALTVAVPPRMAASPEIAAALVTVPRTVPNKTTDPVLTTWSITKAAAKSTLVLHVDDPADDTTQVFVEASDGAFVPVPTRVEARAQGQGGRSVHHVDLGTGADLAALRAKPLTVTLVGAKGQSETSISMEKATE